MKRKILFLLLSGFVLFSTANCTKDIEPTRGNNNQIIVNTRNITAITSQSAQTGGDIIQDGGDDITERGVCWSTGQSPTISNNKNASGKGSGGFISQLIELNPKTTYYVRAYTISSQGTIYGDQRSFRTLAKIPVITTLPVTNITSLTANTGGTDINDGGETIIQRGICWSSINRTPSIFDTKILSAGTTANYAITISGLAANTTYYIRAFATSSVGTGYGAVVEFKTAAAKIPVLSVATVSNIAFTSVTASATLISAEGAAVSEYGYCWSLSQNPTVNNSIVKVSGSPSSIYYNLLSPLNTATRYYVRAYAKNAVGIGYSPTSTEFTTMSIQVPTLTTPSVSSIGVNSARLASSISNDGGSGIIERGFYVSRNVTPTESNSVKYSSSSGINSFAITATNLLSRTTYYVKSFAKNSAGISLSTTTSFVTR
jgi:hypothetical protein